MEAGLSSWLVGAGNKKVVSRIQLPAEDHLPLIGMAVSRSTNWFAQRPTQIKMLPVHLRRNTCQEMVAGTHTPSLVHEFHINDEADLPHVQSNRLVVLVLYVLAVLE